MRIRSLNRHPWQYEARHFYPAGVMEVAPGRWRVAGLEGQRRAGFALDMLAVRQFRIAGNYQAARDRLAFARDAWEAIR